VDEEAERAAWLLRLSSAAIRALDAQSLWQREAEMLALQAAGGPESQPSTAAGGRAALGGRSAVLVGEAELSAALASLGAADRARLASRVFRPSHVLPSMTVEEFGEQELVRMQAEGARKAAQEARRAREEAEKSEEVKEAEALSKSRSWDDWKARARRLAGWGAAH
jgi:immunoglobulin-binding protein 1